MKNQELHRNIHGIHILLTWGKVTQPCPSAQWAPPLLQIDTVGNEGMKSSLKHIEGEVTSEHEASETFKHYEVTAISKQAKR